MRTEVARGLAAAHARGIVHRDVSFKNIMIAFEGDVKLTDFGIAKARGFLVDNEGEVVAGKADYMSPEQANFQITDKRSDIFSAGVVLAHLVLGLLLVLPFVVFGVFHIKNAHNRPNRRAVRVGYLLFGVSLALLFSGIALTRLDFFEIKNPVIRSFSYWVHVSTPLLVVWLYVLHRLAGRPLSSPRAVPRRRTGCCRNKGPDQSAAI